MKSKIGSRKSKIAGLLLASCSLLLTPAARATCPTTTKIYFSGTFDPSAPTTAEEFLSTSSTINTTNTSDKTAKLTSTQFQMQAGATSAASKTYSTTADGQGWIDNSGILSAAGCQILSGTWTISGKMAASSGTQTGSQLNANIFKYNTGTTTFSSALCQLSLSGMTVNTTQTQYTISGSCGAISFNSGDQLYVEIWYLVGSSNTSSSNTATTYWAVNGALEYVTIPGEQASGNNYTATPSETNPATDSLARLYAANPAVSVTLSFSDSVVRIAGYGRGPSETNTASEALAKSEGFPASMTDSVSASEAISRVYAARPSPAETLTFSESAGRTATLARQLAETVSPSDALARLYAAKPTPAETLSASDSLSGSKNGGSHSYSAALAESLTFSELAARTASLVRQPADSVSGSDGLAVSSPVGQPVRRGAVGPHSSGAFGGASKGGGVQGKSQVGSAAGKSQTGSVPKH